MHAVIETTDAGFAENWSRLFANDPLQNPLYAQRSIECLELADKEIHFTDRSFLVISEDEPVFGCSLTLHTDRQGRKCMGYFGMEASTHVNRATMLSSSNNFRPQAIELLQRQFNRLIDEIQPDSLEYLDPVSCGIMSPLTQLLLEKGARPSLQKVQLIDLSLSGRALNRNLRKSHRRLIRWGQRNLHIEIVSGATFDSARSQCLQAGRRQSVAPGATPFSSWQACEQLIRQGDAFGVQAEYRGQLAASALFVHTDKTCHFVFADTMPQSPAQPILLSLVWAAILHSQKLGCCRFDLGCSGGAEVNDAGDTACAAGFGGESQIRLKVTLTL